MSGGHAWSPTRRRAYANDLTDPKTLIAVSGSANRSKGKKDPARWLPHHEAYQCEYVRTWVEIKTRWRLEMDSQEKEAVERVLAGC